MFERIKSLFAAKPVAEFLHPEFGLIVLDSGLWAGKVQHGGRTIPFCVSGSDTAPDPHLLNGVQDVLSRLEELETAALTFISAQTPASMPGNTEFTLYSIDFLWENKPADFAFEFTRTGDMDGIWRVEFERGIPNSLSRDD